MTLESVNVAVMRVKNNRAPTGLDDKTREGAFNQAPPSPSRFSNPGGEVFLQNFTLRLNLWPLQAGTKSPQSFAPQQRSHR